LNKPVHRDDALDSSSYPIPKEQNNGERIIGQKNDHDDKENTALKRITSKSTGKL